MGIFQRVFGALVQQFRLQKSLTLVDVAAQALDVGTLDLGIRLLYGNVEI